MTERGDNVNPVVHPIAKTSQDLRRSINRLDAFMRVNPEDVRVRDGSVPKLIEKLQDAQTLIDEGEFANAD